MSEQQLRDSLSVALLKISDAIHAIEDAQDAGCTKVRIPLDPITHSGVTRSRFRRTRSLIGAKRRGSDQSVLDWVEGFLLSHRGTA